MKCVTLIALVVVSSITCAAQMAAREPTNVAIFLYNEVELLDFAGPAEVFSAAGFNTYTVSVDGLDLTSQGFLRIKPEFAIENAPLPDIIVFPGGNSGPSSNDVRVIDWIKKMHSQKTQFMSVCTGAYIVAKAGLLDHKRVTTHWGSTKRLAKTYPNTTVLEDTRWVDNGFVITTAGVSAGIDGALHFVSRIKGNETATKTARYMEYDKWHPENGIVDAVHPFLTSLLSSAKPFEKSAHEFAPYLGEFLNLSSALLERGDDETALKVLEEGIKIYAHSTGLYQILGTIYRKSGKPAPVAEEQLVSMVRTGEIDAALDRFEQDKKAFPTWKIYSENKMKDAAYFLLLEKKDVEGAIKIFRLNTKEFPQSADTFDSLGEALLAAGNREEAIENYRIAASMGYPNAKKVLAELTAQ